jgi:hypothetical protein
MMLENWSFRGENLVVLNMIREGLFGEIIHCHCAHSHDCTDIWWFDEKGVPRWTGEYLIKRAADQYPTHSLGPVLSWMDINCGDAFDTLVSVANRSISINDHFRRKFGPDHPMAKQRFKQPDIVTSIIKTKKGNTTSSPPICKPCAPMTTAGKSRGLMDFTTKRWLSSWTVRFKEVTPTMGTSTALREEEGVQPVQGLGMR